MRHGRLLVTLSAAAGALALAPAAPALGAVSATVTNDLDQPVPIAAGTTIRNMSAKVGLAVGAGDSARYAFQVAGPDGVAASTQSCSSGTGASPRQVDYRGNGNYTVTVTTHASDDYSCATPQATTTFTYAVNATVSMTGPQGNDVLLRKPNSTTTIPVVIPINQSPGALTTDVGYALNGTLGPDGSITGPAETGFVDKTTNAISLNLSKPGPYVVSARQKGFTTSSGNFFTPFAPPVQFRAYAPFDLSTRPSFLDSRGPSYRVRITFAEPTISGRVSIGLRRGSKGRYKSLGSVKISSKASILKRFRAPRTGTYYLRLSYKTGPTVAGGTIVGKFRITRRLINY